MSTSVATRHSQSELCYEQGSAHGPLLPEHGLRVQHPGDRDTHRKTWIISKQNKYDNLPKQRQAKAAHHRGHAAGDGSTGSPQVIRLAW